MSYPELTKELLSILDLSLIFHEDAFRKGRIDDETCFVFDVTLTYQPEEYFHCRYQNRQTIIKRGWKKVSILLNGVSNYKTVLRINKQHFKYKHCGKTFLVEGSVSDRHRSIVREVKQAILELLSKPISMSLVARMKHTSPTIVIRVLRSLRPKTISLGQPLPEVACFDEFKSVKDVSGAMSFVTMDDKTHQLIDIVENRQLNPLRDYSLRHPRKAREQVRLVVSDFYTPYRTLVKECFPNTRIVAGRFHISQHIGRALTNHRVQVMKTFKKEDRRSKHLKKYWRLLQKNAWELNGQHRC